MSNCICYGMSAILALTIALRPTAAQRIEVTAIDTPLVISGWKGDPRGLVGNILLTARGGSVSHFYFYSSELRPDPITGPVIGRDQVDLVEPLSERKLDENVPKNFRVRVDGFDRPGIYRGKIEIRPGGVVQGQSLIFSLTVIPRIRPTLIGIPSDTLTLNLAQCGWSCLFARRILPAGWYQDTLPVYLENPTSATVILSTRSVVVKGEKSGYRPRAADITLAHEARPFAPNQVAPLELVVHREALPPDRYTGVLNLVLEGADQPKRVVLDLSLRAGPLVPLLVICLGVLFGRLVKYMQEGGEAQATALGAIRQVETQAAGIHPTDAALLRPMLEEVRQAVYAQQVANVRHDLNAITRRLQALAQLRTLETELRLGVGLSPDIQRKLDEIRGLLSRKEDEEARLRLKDLSQELAQAQPPQSGRAAVRALRTSGQPVPGVEPSGSKVEKARRWFLHRLYELSGHTNEFRAEATYWIGRPVLWLMLLLLLVGVGFTSLYVEKGTTFGADPFGDYFALLIWGVSADVISRGLTNLRGAG